MTITEEIITVANMLADQGKKPSVALVKTRLSQPVPLPTLISVLKSWQHQPNYQTKEPQNTRQAIQQKNDSEISYSFNKGELEKIIAQALQPLKAELAEIKKQIQEIKNLK